MTENMAPFGHMVSVCFRLSIASAMPVRVVQTGQILYRIDRGDYAPSPRAYPARVIVRPQSNLVRQLRGRQLKQTRKDRRQHKNIALSVLPSSSQWPKEGYRLTAVSWR